MSCKHLTNRIKTINGIPSLNGTSSTRIVSVPACKLGRPLDETNWAEKCRNVSPEGSCWLWLQWHNDRPDQEFEKEVNGRKAPVHA